MERRRARRSCARSTCRESALHQVLAAGVRSTETFYSFTSFTVPTTIYRLDLTTGKSTVFRQPNVAFDPAAYETKQVFYRSKDGTRVPMFITHKRGLKLDGANPTLLYGYGGFDISLTPAPSRFQRSPGWRWAGSMPCRILRGGGEFGEPWHRAGMKRRKAKRVRRLHRRRRVVSHEQIHVAGEAGDPRRQQRRPARRRGDDATARTLRRALPAVGVMDMLRFHKFTIGWAWTCDYGSSDNAEEFKALYAYSPLHNLSPGTQLSGDADHDGGSRRPRRARAQFQVRRAHSRLHKLRQTDLIRIETKAGHGAGKPTAKVIEEASRPMGAPS